jgi:uncharacterized protein YycO
MQRIEEPVSVWTGDRGEPQRLVWGARRFRVTDTPTRSGGGWIDADVHALITHPTEVAGTWWRFQGTADDGESHMFDVRLDPRGRWQLVRVYD